MSELRAITILFNEGDTLDDVIDGIKTDLYAGALLGTEPVIWNSEVPETIVAIWEHAQENRGARYRVISLPKVDQ